MASFEFGSFSVRLNEFGSCSVRLARKLSFVFVFESNSTLNESRTLVIGALVGAFDVLFCAVIFLSGRVGDRGLFAVFLGA